MTSWRPKGGPFMDDGWSGGILHVEIRLTSRERAYGAVGQGHCEPKRAQTPLERAVGPPAPGSRGRQNTAPWATDVLYRRRIATQSVCARRSCMEGISRRAGTPRTLQPLLLLNSYLKKYDVSSCKSWWATCGLYGTG